MYSQISFPLLLLLAVFVILIFKKHLSSKKSHNSPPSPPSLPVLGHFHLIKNNPLHISLASLASLYGSIFSLRLGCKSFLVISSPSAVEECLIKNDIVFANRPTSMAADLLSYNYTAFAWSSYGHPWRILRKISIVELFSSHSLRKSAQIREQEILKLGRSLHKLCKETWKRVDLNQLISIYSINIMMRCVAGKELVGEGEIGEEAGKEAVERFRGVFTPSVALGVCDYFPVLRWIGFKGMEKDLMAMNEKRDEFLQGLVDEVRAQKKTTEERRKKSLIETLLSLQEEEPEFYSDDIVKGILMVMLSAGPDTIAVTVEWAMSRLLAQPEKMQKLREEMDENVGHSHLLNDADLPNLPYLRCVINETLRLHRAAPLQSPHISSDKCVVGGYNIPRGTILMVNAWAMHRDPNLWDEPDGFIPDRFQFEKEGYKFAPFGVGRRACPGASMALRTVCLALGVFVQCFEWERSLEVDFEDNLRVTLNKAKPLEAVCIVRNQAAHLLLKLS